MSSLRKKDSKTLSRIRANDGSFTGFYHSTPTLVYNRPRNTVTFNNGGWETISTNKSQDFFLDDIGLANLRVAMRKGVPTLIDKDLNHLAEIKDGKVFLMNHLQRWNIGEKVNV